MDTFLKQERKGNNMNINTVIIGGNITHDLKLRYLPNGTACVDFSIANNCKYKKNDEMVEDVSFINITEFGRTAENISKYFAKGSPILVEGRLKTDQWEQEGKKRSKTKVIGDRFQFCGGEKVDKSTEGKEL